MANAADRLAQRANNAPEGKIGFIESSFWNALMMHEIGFYDLNDVEKRMYDVTRLYIQMMTTLPAPEPPWNTLQAFTADWGDNG